MNTVQLTARVQELLDRGVVMPAPQSVTIAESLRADRVAPGVIIHPGCRLSGAETAIGPGSVIGAEAPVTLDNCQLGHQVELKGGFFSGATFLDKAAMGSNAQVRPGTLLEEEASGAHTVGFKQTIFLSFVTAGSLINFCDALMAGGTGRKHHSEIGSSYIHFNFTPHGDKATASLLGDVPHGVFLDRPPIFLGGQGGLVGPVRLAFGTVLPAGAICRQDVLTAETLLTPRNPPARTRAFVMGAYGDIDRVVRNNLIYIGNLWALRQWYREVRRSAMSGDPFRVFCYEGALRRISEGITERIERLGELAGKMSFSLTCTRAGGAAARPEIVARQRQLLDGWPEMAERLAAGPADYEDNSVSSAAADTAARARDAFLREWNKISPANGYIAAVAALEPATRQQGVAWLQSVVEAATRLWQ